MSHKTGNDHLVIGVLRESQPAPGQFRRQLQQVEIRIRRDTQVDLGIDHADFEGHTQGHIGQRIDAARTVAPNAAKHEALAIVPLLHPRIQIAVLVQGDKELGQQRFGLRLIETSAVQIGLEIGPHVLVESPQTTMVVAAHPQHRVTEAQKLKGSTERTRFARGHLLQHVCHILPEPLSRPAGITIGQRQHRVDGLNGTIEEFHGGRIGGQPRPCRLGRRPTAQQSLVEDHLPIGTDVADRAQLMQLSVRRQSDPVRRVVQWRNGLHGSHKHDAFVGGNDHLFGLTHTTRQASASPHPRKALSFALGEDSDLRPTTQTPVRAIADRLSHAFQTAIHSPAPLRLCTPPQLPSIPRL